ncbi:hypothetical protein [Pelomonas sp. KK5]|uniref:hypothetical protein n=1 Tax=Pelomonas sp. KK5 TaxID=1855730 RepID=UPI001301E061|nr:hypothetical protein [Pelomonas sp. KK5]
MSRLDAAAPGTKLSLSGGMASNAELPQQLPLASKATGQYLFKATSAGGQTMFGLLPLHVNGGTMATSILLFAPALVIGGFRDTYPFYQFDPDAGFIRYKMKEQDEWRMSKPTQAESDRARVFFEKGSFAACAGGKEGCVAEASR